MALSGIVNKPTIQPQEVLKDSDSALRPVKGVPQTALNPVEGDTTLSVGGDRALIDRLSAQLPGFKGVVPVAYRDGLVSVRQDLAQTARKTNDRDLAQAITRAAKLIDQEQGLIVAMDIYRNLLHRA